MYEYKNKDFLQEEYLNKRRSLSDIGKQFNISPKLVYYYVKKFGLNIKGTTSNITINESMFKWSDPIFCYMCGLIITDGHLDYPNKRVCLSFKNKGSEEVLNNFIRYFNCSNSVKHTRNNCNYFSIHSEKLLSILASYGIDGKKVQRTFDLGKVKKLSKDCQRMFFRGILDGDGNIRLKGEFRISCKSESFIQNITVYINYLLGTNYTMKYSSNQTGYLYPHLCLKLRDSEKWLKFLYEDFPTYRFHDKYERYYNIFVKGEEIV